jgi:hypothetical protein
MEEILSRHALAYASRHQLQLAERLGFGIHGVIFVAMGKSESGKTAVKTHRSREPYLREREAYERLMEAGVSEILGFRVPLLLRFDDALLVVEMTVVERPFVLDFAGAWLDARRSFRTRSGLNGKATAEALAKEEAEP